MQATNVVDTSTATDDAASARRATAAVIVVTATCSSLKESVWIVQSAIEWGAQAVVALKAEVAERSGQQAQVH